MSGRALERLLSTLVRGPLLLFFAYPLCATIVCLLAVVRREWLYAATGPVSRMVLFVAGVRLRIEGEFPREGTFIVMMNHSSFIDPFLLGAFLKGRFTGVIAVEMMRIPVFGAVMRRYNAIPIVRHDQGSALASLQRAQRALASGYHVCLLPEGTRTTNGELGELKSGGFYMALATRASILPVGVRGAFDFKPKHRFTIAPGPVRIRIGKPISPEPYEAAGPGALKERVHAELRGLMQDGEAPVVAPRHGA